MLHSPALAWPYVDGGWGGAAGEQPIGRQSSEQSFKQQCPRHRHLRIFLAAKLTDAQIHKAPSPLPLWLSPTGRKRGGVEVIVRVQAQP